MLRRRKVLKDGGRKLPNMKDDSEEGGMRHYIANPAFLPTTSADASPDLNFPLINIPLASTHREDKDVVMTEEASPLAAQNIEKEGFPMGPPAKKAKSVRWAA